MTIFREVRAQEAARQPGGLFSAARPAPQGETPEDWANGLAWRTERCVSYEGVPLCAEPGDGEESPNTVEYHQPTQFRVYDECTTLNGELDTGRVERQADAILGYVAARELWDGPLTVADPYDSPQGTGLTNNYLSKTGAATVIGSDAYERYDALVRLEQAARDAARGQQVYLHVPLAALPDTGLTKVGDVLYTQHGSVVVTDGGYPGTGPGASAPTETLTWAYATGPVQLRWTRLDPLVAPAETLDRATNRRRVWANRLFAVTFDPCVHFAIRVALPPDVTP